MQLGKEMCILSRLANKCGKVFYKQQCRFLEENDNSVCAMHIVFVHIIQGKCNRPEGMIVVYNCISVYIIICRTIHDCRHYMSIEQVYKCIIVSISISICISIRISVYTVCTVYIQCVVVYDCRYYMSKCTDG